MRLSRPLLAFSLLAQHTWAAPKVKLRGTDLVGRDITDSKVDFFGGIPYAEPPVGKRRFRAPVPQTYLKDVKTFDASNFGKSCLQPAVFGPPGPISEDCLSINIYRPSGTKRNDKLPVLFWVYGGAFLIGGADLFNASALVARSIERETPIIYVNFNYRLGPFGYPQGQEAHDRRALNLGLKDVLAALQWVHANIGEFGGDRRKVTIFGESAGGMSIGALYFSPAFASLVRGAILESGAANGPAAFSAPEREGAWRAWVKSVPSCAALAAYTSTSTSTSTARSDTFPCLQNASEAEIAQAYLSGSTEFDFLTGLMFAPTLDAGPGGLFPDFPSRLYKQGKFARIPFIAGTNLDEGTLFSTAFRSPNATSEFLRSSIVGTVSPPPRAISPAKVDAAADELMALYPDAPALGSPYQTGDELWGLPSVYKRASSLQGDQTFDAPRRHMSQAAASHGLKSYGYLFTDPQPFGDPSNGVPHGAEVGYIYGAPFFGPGADTSSPQPLGSDALRKRQAADTLSTQMMDYWISFTVTLNPNDNKGSNRPVWPEYTSKNKVILQLDGHNTTVIKDTFRQEGIASMIHNALVFRR